MKILVVEDEPKTGSYLKQGLTEAGFVADLVRDGNQGLHAAVTEAHDLIVLDVSLFAEGKRQSRKACAWSIWSSTSYAAASHVLAA
jgi:DNA-binding response OmpR family regulator